ncbi:hypothetical protein SM021_002356 [Cronobacter muytjensii]|nr:hypothetical protein [Cronobacter muytjensii]
MNLLERAEASQLSDFEISKLREIIILHINTDAADEAIRTLPENADDYRALKQRVATRQYRFLSMAQIIKNRPVTFHARAYGERGHIPAAPDYQRGPQGLAL